MYQPIQITKAITSSRISPDRPPLRRGLLIAFALAWIGLSLTAKAVTPPPDGGYPGYNTAEGADALFFLAGGIWNTAVGASALHNNTTGYINTAVGTNALRSNSRGRGNAAEGSQALFSNTTGSFNIALGHGAGLNLTTGDHNIDIGNVGNAGESNTIRIGGYQNNTYIAGISGATVAGGVTVIIDSEGHLGVATSSKRFKEEIRPMDKASEAILALKPVTFRYKHELDAKGVAQFGLVAEEVEKVDPDLVARDADGKIYTVRYEAVNAMLLNEFLKEHRKVQEQEATMSQLKSTVTALAARLEKQASKIQKMSNQMEASKATPQVVLNNH